MAETSPRLSFEREASLAIANLRNPAADRRLIHESLATLSKSSLHRGALFHSLSALPQPELVKLQERLTLLTEHFPSNPVSYGFTGGFRSIINVLTVINLHLALQGYESLNLLSQPSLVNINAMTTVFYPTMIGLGLYADALVYFREKGMDAEFRLAKKNILELLDRMDSKTFEPRPPTDPLALLSRARTTMDLRSATLAIAELRDLLKGVPENANESPVGVLDAWDDIKALAARMQEQYRSLKGHRDELVDLLHSLTPAESLRLKPELEKTGLLFVEVNPEWVTLEEKLTEQFRDLFDRHPSLRANELIRESHHLERGQQLAVGKSHTIRTAAQRTIFITTVSALLMGAYGTIGPDIRVSDYVVPLLGINLDEVFRAFWENPVVPKVFGGLVAGSWFWQAWEHRQNKREEMQAKRNLLPRYSWDLIRSAILAAEGQRGATGPVADEPAVSPREILTELTNEKLLHSGKLPVAVIPLSRFGLAHEVCVEGFRAIAVQTRPLPR